MYHINDDTHQGRFMRYLRSTNKIKLVICSNADGTPNMKHIDNRSLYEDYLLNRIPSYECSICLEVMKDNGCKLKCGHVFCVECFANLARTSNRCALCRRAISHRHIKNHDNMELVFDIIHSELHAEHSDRNSLNMVDFVYHVISNTTSPENYYASANTIVLEMHDSLHTVVAAIMEFT